MYAIQQQYLFLQYLFWSLHDIKLDIGAMA